MLKEKLCRHTKSSTRRNLDRLQRNANSSPGDINKTRRKRKYEKVGSRYLYREMNGQFIIHSRKVGAIVVMLARFHFAERIHTRTDLQREILLGFRDGWNCTLHCAHSLSESWIKLPIIEGKKCNAIRLKKSSRSETWRFTRFWLYLMNKTIYAHLWCFFWRIHRSDSTLEALKTFENHGKVLRFSLVFWGTNIRKLYFSGHKTSYNWLGYLRVQQM